MAEGRAQATLQVRGKPMKKKKTKSGKKKKAPKKPENTELESVYKVVYFMCTIVNRFALWFKIHMRTKIH